MPGVTHHHNKPGVKKPKEHARCEGPIFCHPHFLALGVYREV